MLGNYSFERGNHDPQQFHLAKLKYKKPTVSLIITNGHCELSMQKTTA